MKECTHAGLCSDSQSERFSEKFLFPYGRATRWYSKFLLEANIATKNFVEI